jgi:hypothetical protein
LDRPIGKIPVQIDKPKYLKNEYTESLKEDFEGLDKAE